MTKLLTGLAVGAVLFIGAGIAQAEPVTLTISQMDSVSAAGARHKHKKFSPNVAEASAYADAFGKSTYTNTYTATFTTPWSSSSTSSSKSVTF